MDETTSPLPPLPRRAFLGGAAAALASTAGFERAVRAAEEKAPGETLTVAVIGHTGRGNFGHPMDTLWLNLPDITIAGVADPDAEGRASAVERLGLSADRGYADYREMLEALRPDLVSVAPRHIDQHREMAVAAAEAGAKGIYMEKPFCRDLEESDAVVEACERHGTRLAFGMLDPAAWNSLGGLPPGEPGQRRLALGAWASLVSPMPTLNWIGKEAVIKHHQEVPYRLLEPDPGLGLAGDEGAGGAGAPAGNLIVEGDNLHALKALLPRYAGQVKCIYIDPPYNTGNEGWVYNDKVKAPEIVKWLGETVGKEAEDLSRHDKWLCMMYPRLVLLKQFLRDDGAIFVSIDDNEVASLRLLMDEIFGRGNFVADLIWRASDNSNNDASQFSTDFNHTIIYSRSPDWSPNRLPDPDKQSHFRNPDNDLNGPWFDGNPLNSPNYRANLVYDVISPTGHRIKPPRNGWRWSPETLQTKIETGEIRFTDDGKRFKRRTYLKDAKGLPPSNLWVDVKITAHNRQAKYELMEIFGTTNSKAVFPTPKPVRFIQRILQIATDKDSLVLDSFAGSGTTGHAVLKQNAEDGGTRKFLLVEMEPGIARDITAERVRRVAAGYTDAKGKAVPGLGGAFQYCRLSAEPLFNEFGDIRDDVGYAQLADFVWFAETGTGYAGRADSPLLGVHEGRAVYLLFNGVLGDRRPDGGNILTRPVLETLPPHEGERTVYAAATRLGDAALRRAGITFKQTPYAIGV